MFFTWLFNFEINETGKLLDCVILTKNPSKIIFEFETPLYYNGIINEDPIFIVFSEVMHGPSA